MQVHGKTWVVTGGGSGIGRQLVLQLLDRGARVAAVDLRAETLQETASLAGADERLSLHVLDITDRDAVAALPDQVAAAHGAVDGIINNAGIMQPFVQVKDLDYPTIMRVLDVNLMGTTYMVKAFLPVLLQRPQAHIANVSSMGGFFPFPGQTMYGASKAAVKLLTEGLYAELLDTDVAVSVIMPGGVATNIAENSGVPAMGAEDSSYPVTPADTAARIMLDGIERNKLHIYVGKDALLMSIAIKLAPRRAIAMVQRQMAKLGAPEVTEAPAVQ